MGDRAPGWAEALYCRLRAEGVTLFAYVPDGGHRHLIERAGADGEATAIPLTTEEEGVALLCGAHLGGARGVLLCQSSGVGNCINMLSLAATGRFPLAMIVTMRGEFGEQNPWQLPMGRATPGALDAIGVHCLRAERADEVDGGASATLNMAYRSQAAVALLLSQKLLGAKRF